MDTELNNLMDRLGGAYIRSLVAAETAVRRGEFATAKILRAAGNIQRTLAMRLLRLQTAEPDSRTLLEAIFMDLRALDTMTKTAVTVVPAEQEILEQIVQSRQQVEVLVRTSLESLNTQGEIVDSLVPQMFFVCQNCGGIVAHHCPETCAVCGALSVEFAWFGPFYAETPERLGRLSPTKILATLEATPAEIVQITSDVPEAVLCYAPSTDHWCAKVIIGHLVETDRLFVKRAAGILERDDIPDLSTPGSPWVTHEGKAYEHYTIDALSALFTEARALSLSLIRDLPPEQWSRHGAVRDTTTALLDLGIWLANHDLGHCAQIRRLCGK